MARKYTLKSRARKQQETRDRILTAVIALHEEIGPAQTSISAIAERAGVQRLTVYRHFPDEPALFEACRDHWFDQNPMPDPDALRELADPRARLHRGLLEMYSYFERTEQMTANVIRDAALSDTVANAMQPTMIRLAGIHQALTECWDVPDSRQALFAATVAHAIDFSTWHSLVRRQGLSHDQAADLMLCLVDCALSPQCSL
jgi:AcrR family transcriptional regulator